MIDFSKIEKHSIGYDIIKRLVGFQISPIYYRKIFIRGKERVPKDGRPIMFLSNHQNGLMDALMILRTLPFNMHSVFLARADIFKKEKMAKILRWMRIMPIFRQRDGLENLEENKVVFDKSVKLINDGYPLCLFPEGTHQEGHFLGNMKKGFSRIALDAAKKNNFPQDMLLIPVGNHYEDYRAFGSRVLITYGEPIHLADYYELYKENSPAAYTKLTQDIKPALHKIMLDINVSEHYDIVDFLREALRKEMAKKIGFDISYFPHQLDADQALVEHIHELEKEHADTLFLEKAKIYKKRLDKYHLSDLQIRENISFLRLFFQSVLFLLCLPFSLFGAVFSAYPLYKLRDFVWEKVCAIQNPMLFASFHFVLTSVVFFPLLFFILFIISWIFSGSFFLAIFFWISLEISKWIYIQQRNFLYIFSQRWRAFFWIQKNKNIYQSLFTQRKELIRCGKLPL